MNAKHLFLTFITTIICSATALCASIQATDAISTSTITAKGYNVGLAGAGDYWYNSASTGNSVFTNWKFNTSAEYASGDFYCDFSEGIMGISVSGNSFASKKSGGKVKSITVTWAGSGYNTGSSTLKVYASNDAFTGKTGETASTLGSRANTTRVHTFTYGAGSNTYSFTSDYEYIALVGSTDGAYFTEISITWEWEDLPTYKVYKGTITGTWGDISLNGTAATEIDAHEGDEIVVTFTPKRKMPAPFRAYSLIRYSFDNMVFEMSCGEYPTYPDTYVARFPMPARDVTVDAEFDYITKTQPEITIDNSVTEVKSGTSAIIPFTFTNEATGDAITGYTATMTATSGNTSVLTVETPVKVSDGNYTFTVHGLQTGSSLVTIDAPSAGNVNATNSSITITVTPREVALVSEISGAEGTSYYAVKNSIDDGYAEAAALIKVGDDYYGVPTEATVADMTWKAASINEAGTQVTYQNSADKYLSVGGDDKDELALAAGSFTWRNVSGYRYYKAGDNYLVYKPNINYFTMLASNTGGAKEVDIEKIHTAYRFTSDAGATANLRDDRAFYDGKIATICVPFDVSAEFVSKSGADFYTIYRKVVSADNRMTGIILDLATSLTAGHSYIVIAKGDAINLFYQSVATNNAVVDAHDGFVGCLPGDGTVTFQAGVTPKCDGDYGMKSDQLHYVAGGNSVVKPYRALVRGSEIETLVGSPSPAPGRRVLMSTDALEGEEIITSVVDFTDEILIDWNQPVYNIVGIQVGKGTKGVLIQNGQKFIVQ